MNEKKHDRSKVLSWIRSFIERRGYPPTIREIGEANNISSTGAVNYVLDDLIKDGKLERDPGVSRGLRIKDA